MVRKSVVDYIKSQLKSGYGISTIRDVMLRYGYTNKDIDSAINEIYPFAEATKLYLENFDVSEEAL